MLPFYGDKPMSYLEELLPEFRNGAKIRRKDWGEKKYIKLCGLYAKDEYGDSYFLEPNELTADDWEIYQEPIDWDYIIKNKCLCWFWDGINKKIINTLTWFEKGYTFPYQSYGGVKYRNCHPARRDEVSFYEDRESE